MLDFSDGALVSFHARGYAKWICFKDHAQGVLKLAQTDSTEDIIENIVRAIYDECKDLKIDAENYDTHVSCDRSMDFTPATPIKELKSIPDRFTNFLFSTLISNIVTSVVKNNATPLQLSLGILFQHSKMTISYL